MQEIRMNWRRTLRVAGSAAAVALVLAAGPRTLGQATTATLVGTVTDTLRRSAE